MDPDLQTTARAAPGTLERMSTRTPGDDVPVRPIDRLLAFMSLGLLLLSVLAFFAIMIGSSTGADMSAGVWPAVGILVYIAPVVAFILLLTVLVMSLVRRSRANRGD
ncbi:hypothetical protein GCM10017607_05400 [Microbacterium thalassium]|nr:hypothetical protein GCM10017607_05400 [Microbacterium thalassium]